MKLTAQPGNIHGAVLFLVFASSHAGCCLLLRRQRNIHTQATCKEHLRKSLPIHRDDFLHRHKGLKVLFLELGVGNNTPAIIKYPFWRITQENPEAAYVCINYNEAYAPSQLQTQSSCIDGDIGDMLESVR